MLNPLHGMGAFRNILLTAAAIFMAVTVLASSCSGGRYSGPVQSIKIGTVPLEPSVPIIVAVEKNFFMQYGLDVSVNSYDAGLGAVNAMLKDEIDVSFAAEYVLVGKAFNKDEIKAIASINEADFAYIIGRKDRGIQSISDLKGKKIGVARGTVLEFYLGRFLQLHGLSPEDVIMVDVALSKSADSIVSGESDALISFKPYTDLAQHELGDDVVVWPAQNSQALYALIICRDQWINQDPGRVERLLKALSAAEDFITQHPQEAKDITKRQLGFSDTYMDTVWPKQQYSLSLDQSLVTAMEDEARWMISNNLTAETQVPDFLRYIYVDGLNEVKPAAVNIIR